MTVVPRIAPFLLTALWLAGCAAPRPRILTGPGPDLDVATWLAANRIGPFEDVKAVPVARTASTSHAIVQVRTRERPHVHETHDLTVHVVAGTGRMVLAAAPGGTLFVLSVQPVAPGDSIVIGRGTIHWFENAGATPAVAFATFTPPFDGTDTVSTPLMAALGRFLDSRPRLPAQRVEGVVEAGPDGGVALRARPDPEPR